MKYKVGDKVKIKEDISHCLGRDPYGKMDKWQGKTMTIREVTPPYYQMEEDIDECISGWCWPEELIEGLVETELSNTEILQLAIDTYGDKKQTLVCIEEMSELTKAFIKLYRADDSKKEKAKWHVQEEIADVCVMMQQAKMIFGEKKIDKIVQWKINRLHYRLKDEREVEVVDGVHEIGGKTYIWINPDKHFVSPGGIAMADTKYGEKPIIITSQRTEKMKHVKQHRKIIRGCENE